jgi:FKBP-type peptidyl-prolyl cis-trans isomerase FkpA
MNLKLPLVAAFVAVIGLTACGGDGGSAGSGAVVENAPAYKVTETLAGSGKVAAAGTIPTIKYTGWLYSSTATGNKGTQFGSGTVNAPGTPARDLARLGNGSLIAGVDQGVTGMQVGARRTVVVPSNLGYGAAGSPPNIPGNTGLVFDVELTAVD